MRGLLAAVIAMGVLIVAGLVVVGVTIVHRLDGAAAVALTSPADIVLDQPAGTQIAGVAALGSRVAVTLHGGGADRVVVLEGGRVVGTIRLAR